LRVRLLEFRFAPTTAPIPGSPGPISPRIFRPDSSQKLVYALGYGGNGVSYSAQAGRIMAQMLAGKPFAGQDLPIFTSPLPTHPVTPFRRGGQL